MTIHDIAITLDPELDTRAVAHLLDCFGSAEELFAATTDEIVQRTELREDLARRISGREFHPAAEQEMEFASRNRINILSSDDPRYPQALKECDDYPHVLYVKGETDFNAGKWLTVVGTRDMTQYGRHMCEDVVADLAVLHPETVVVSGLAYGVDVTAQTAALKAGFRTIAVLGQPLTHIYPSKHTSIARRIVDSGGALVSEYFSGHVTHKNDFVERNRIVAGLSAGTVIIESAGKGGSLYTADMADSYHRVVMAVPGRATDRFSEGTNGLIRSMKAQMVCSGADVASALGWEPKDNFPLAATENRDDLPGEGSDAGIVLGLMGDEPVSLEELTVRSGMSASQLSTVLFDLEMDGHIETMPGKMYIKR